MWVESPRFVGQRPGYFPYVAEIVRLATGTERVMEHWPAALAASVIAVVMVLVVVLVSFRVAGPAPPYLFINQPTVGVALPH